MKNQTINPEEYFYSNDGRVFSSIDDLFRGLKEMNEETFFYHLNKEKNDFYNWILYVFKESELANSIIRVKTKTGFLKKLKDFCKADTLKTSRYKSTIAR